MVSKYFTLLVECCLAVLVTSSIQKRSYQLEVCPQDAVCSEIISLPSQGLGHATYMLQFKCKCPSGSECPAQPGSQTISTDTDKWYGVCQPTDDIPQCKRDDIAQQIIKDTIDVTGQTYTKVHCLCPNHALTEGNSETYWSSGNTASHGAKFVRNFICNDDVMSKRERYGGRGRSRGRFYFYRK
ncbi:hypothetical protein ACF0H5_020641 [Mactra antiquata]